MTEIRRFDVWDYVVFGAMLGLSAIIGIYSALSGGRQSSADEVLLGNRRLNPIAVGLSIMATSISAIAIIGTPSEIYNYNTMFGWVVVSYIPANIFISVFLLPVYSKLEVTSIYEYLELRFNRRLRIFGTIVCIINSSIYHGIAIYTPALAINAVTGMHLAGCILSTGVVCTFYTTVGGMKAVVWTDTLQSCIMVIGVVAVIVKGSVDVGGVDEVLKRSIEGDRIEFFETNPDPTIIYTVWSVLLGMGTWNISLGTSQTVLQRLLSCGSRKRATVALYVSMLAYMVINGVCVFSGVVMYAYYYDCDPYTSGKVERSDQIMLLLVMDLFRNTPGIPGLFLAAVAGASLSTLSSGLNALAAVTGEDIVKTIYPRIRPMTYTLTLKALVLLYGIISIFMAFLAKLIGQSILQMALSIGGLVSGGMLGTFLLGIYFHRTNTWGALAGLVSSLSVLGWIKIGSFLHPSSRGRNTLSVAGCPSDEGTETTPNYYDVVTPWAENINDIGDVTSSQGIPSLIRLYHVSYLYYTLIGLIVTVVVGIVVSGATGFTDPAEVDSRLKHNMTDALFGCLPESLKNRLRSSSSDKSTIMIDGGENLKLEKLENAETRTTLL